MIFQLLLMILLYEGTKIQTRKRTYIDTLDRVIVAKEKHFHTQQDLY